MLHFEQNVTGGIFSLSPCLFPSHRVWSSSIWPPLWSQMPASVLILIRIDSLHARFLSQHPLKLCCQGSQIQQWCRKIGEPIYLSISCLLLTFVLLRRPAAAWWEVIGWWAGWISRCHVNTLGGRRCRVLVVHWCHVNTVIDLAHCHLVIRQHLWPPGSYTMGHSLYWQPQNTLGTNALHSSSVWRHVCLRVIKQPEFLVGC